MYSEVKNKTDERNKKKI